MGNVTEYPYNITNTNVTAISYTTSTNYTLSSQTDMTQNITTFNYDMFASLASDLDETPYLISARALKEGIVFINNTLRTLTYIKNTNMNSLISTI